MDIIAMIVALIVVVLVIYMVMLVIDYNRFAKDVRKKLEIVFRKKYTLSKVKDNTITKYYWENSLSSDECAKEIAANGHHYRRITDEHEENAI